MTLKQAKPTSLAYLNETRKAPNQLSLLGLAPLVTQGLDLYPRHPSASVLAQLWIFPVDA